MARNTGTFNQSFNYEVLYKSTLDARQLVDDFSDLLAFTDANYIPNGFTVAVVGKTNPTERGLYMCIDEDNLNSSTSWIRLDNSSQDNKIKVINEGHIDSVLVDLVNNKIDEELILKSIYNYFVKPSNSGITFNVEEDEILIFNISCSIYEDYNEPSSFKFSQIRKYIFKLGKGSYTYGTLFNNWEEVENVLELIYVENTTRFVDLKDINLANKGGLILTVNEDEDGLEYKTVEQIIEVNGFETEYVIDLMDNNELTITLNSKLIIRGIESYAGNINNLKINGNVVGTYPITFNGPFPEIMKIENDNDSIINLKITKFIFG